MPGNNIQDCLPLTEATYYILLSLARVPRHGYAIMQTAQALSAGRVALGTGTLYGAVKRLQQQGWIEPGTDRSPTGRQRKTYALTGTGHAILQAEIQRLHALVAAAEKMFAPE
jgi:DNA-binding PadR family transcriptional regulator